MARKVGIIRCIVLVLLILVFAGIIVFSRPYLYSGDLAPVLLFILFVIFYIMIPGLILLSILGIRFQSRITKYPVAFFIGTGIIFAEYFICAMLHKPDAIIIVSPIITVFTLIILLRRRPKEFAILKIPKLNIKKIDLFFVLFLVLVFASSIITLRNFYTGSLITKRLAIYQDFVWHMGNINALSVGLPPIDPRIDGFILVYHYFADLLYAICKNVTGISSDILVMTCTPYVVTFVFGFSMYAFFREYTIKKRFTGVYCLLILLPCITLVGKILEITNNSYVLFLYMHVLTNVNAMAFAISLFLLFLIIIKYLFSEQMNWSVLLCLAIIIMLLTGFKGPLGIVAVGGMILYLCFTIVFKREAVRRCIVILGVTTVSFAVIYLFVISGIQFQLNFSGADAFVFAFTQGTISNAPVFQHFYNEMPQTYLTVLLLLLANMILTFGFYWLPALLFVCRTLKNTLFKKDGNLNPTFLMALIVLMVTIVTYITVFGGQGQLYFLFVAFPIVQLFALKYLENIAWKTITGKIVIPIFILGLICSVYVLVEMHTLGIKNGVLLNNNVNSEKAAYGYVQRITNSNSFNKHEYEAMRWIRNNTSHEALFATNRTMLNKGNHRQFYYSAYSERQFFLEGFAYQYSPDLGKDTIEKRILINESLFQNSNENRIETAYKEGIDFFVIFKEITSDFDISSDNSILVFDNPSISIYQMRITD